MVYVFHSSLKHKCLISIPCGRPGRKRGKLLSQRIVLISSSAVYFFLIQAEVHVALKAVWDAGGLEVWLVLFSEINKDTAVVY